MSNNLVLETAIAQLPVETQYLVRECAHELQRVLERYGRPAPFVLLPSSLALDLVLAKREDSIRY